MRISRKLRIRAHECIFFVLGNYGVTPPSFDSFPPQTRLALLRTAMIMVCSAANPASADELQGTEFSAWLRVFCPEAIEYHHRDTFSYWLSVLREADPQFYYKLSVWPA